MNRFNLECGDLGRQNGSEATDFRIVARGQLKSVASLPF